MKDCLKLLEYLGTNRISIINWSNDKLEEYGIPLKDTKSFVYTGAVSYGSYGHPNRRHDIEELLIRGPDDIRYRIGDIAHHGSTHDIISPDSVLSARMKTTDSLIEEIKNELMRLAQKKALSEIKEEEEQSLKKKAINKVFQLLLDK